MLKALVHRPKSGNLLVLGLDAENVKRLQDGQPIVFDARIFGAPMDISIVVGTTLDDIRNDLKVVGIDLPPADA